MRSTYYFEIGSSPRRVVRLTARDAVPRLGIEYSSVADEMTSEEYSLFELRNRLELANNAVTRLGKRLERPDGHPGAPRDERERGKWERERLAARTRIPTLERMVEEAERKVAMLHAVLAGKQDTDRLPPRKVRPVEETPADEVSALVEEEGEIHALGDDDQPEEETPTPREPDRVGEIARHLDYLNIPTDVGRRRVREMLGTRDPEFKVGDALLNDAIQYRRPADVS